MISSHYTMYRVFVPPFVSVLCLRDNAADGVSSVLILEKKIATQCYRQANTLTRHEVY